MGVTKLKLEFAVPDTADWREILLQLCAYRTHKVTDIVGFDLAPKSLPYGTVFNGTVYEGAQFRQAYQYGSVAFAFGNMYCRIEDGTVWVAYVLPQYDEAKITILTQEEFFGFTDSAPAFSAMRNVLACGYGEQDAGYILPPITTSIQFAMRALNWNFPIVT